MPALQREAAWAKEKLLGDLRRSVPQNGRVHLLGVETNPYDFLKLVVDSYSDWAGDTHELVPMVLVMENIAITTKSSEVAA